MTQQDPDFSFEELLNPVIEALHRLGGSATDQEIEDDVMSNLNLSQTSAVKPHINLAKTHLKIYGLITSTDQGLWMLSPTARNVMWVDESEVVRYVQQHAGSLFEEVNPDPRTWREELLDTLCEMDSDAFERLFMRILHASGFRQVRVTRRDGNGGMEGIGRLKVGGFITLRVRFRLKRDAENLDVSDVRSIRRLCTAQVDNGLLITTARFTDDAILEASRDDLPAVDLVDGQQLVNQLKELNIGVRSEIVENTIVDRDSLLDV